MSNHRALLHEHDVEGTFGSGRWAGGHGPARQKVLDAIYGLFCVQCSRKNDVTKEQVLLELIHTSNVTFFHNDL